MPLAKLLGLCRLALLSGLVLASRAGPPTSPTRAEALRAALADPTSRQIFVAAHRGDWRMFPENSLPAIESAIRLGVDIVEIDVGRTQDGQFVIMHDETLDRTTSGRGRVADHTLAEIRALVLKNGCGVPTTYRVPTLEEALVTVHGRVLLNLDKSYSWFRAFFPLLERTDTTAQVIIKTYSLPAELVQAEQGELLRRVIYMPIVNLRLPQALELAEGHLARTKPVAMELVFPVWNAVSRQVFKASAANGTRIWVNTMWRGLADTRSDDAALDDPEANYGWVIDQGATVIQTDRPEYLLTYLRRIGRHF